LGHKGETTKQFAEQQIEKTAQQLNNIAEQEAPGVYTVNLEVAREHGGHAHRGAQITCGQEPAKAALADGNEFEKAQITYGPGGN